MNRYQFKCDRCNKTHTTVLICDYCGEEYLCVWDKSSECSNCMGTKYTERNRKDKPMINKEYIKSICPKIRQNDNYSKNWLQNIKRGIQNNNVYGNKAYVLDVIRSTFYRVYGYKIDISKEEQEYMAANLYASIGADIEELQQ